MPKQLLLLLALFALTDAKRLAKEKVLYAINCGSQKAVKSVDGFMYHPVR